MAVQVAARAPSPQGGDRNVAVRIELQRPLVGHQGNISVIELREPNLGDYVDCGPIVRKLAHDPRGGSGEMRVEIVDDIAALMQWTVRLTGQHEALLRTLGPRDAQAVLGEVSRIVEEFQSGNSPREPMSSPSFST